MLARPPRLLDRPLLRSRAPSLVATSLLMLVTPVAAQPADPAAPKASAPPSSGAPAHDPEASPTPAAGAPPATAAPTPSRPSADPAAAPTRPLPDAVTSAPAPEPAGEPPPPWLPPTRPPGVPPSAPSAPSPDSERASEDAVNPLLYAGLGTAALGAAGMVVFGVAQSRLVQLENDPGYDAYRAGQPVDSDVCQAADQLQVVDGAASPSRVRRICDEAGTWETVSFVVLPTSIALLGVATYMIVAGSATERERSASLRVVPSAGPDGGALVVEGVF